MSFIKSVSYYGWCISLSLLAWLLLLSLLLGGCASQSIKQGTEPTARDMYYYKVGYLSGLMSASDGKDRMKEYPKW